MIGLGSGFGSGLLGSEELGLGLGPGTVSDPGGVPTPHVSHGLPLTPKVRIRVRVRVRVKV
jgi:hypothetical protein